VNTRRAEAFSDGVFAVAITVLVFNLLEIDSGQHAPALTYQVLLNMSWPQYAAYAVGFLSIGIMWLNHHTIFAHVERIDRVTLVLNILLLMGVVALPFPTALVANHLTGPQEEARVAVVSYGVVMVFISLGYALIWNWIGAHPQTLTVRPIRSLGTVIRFNGGLVGYVAATLIGGLVSAGAAVAIYGALAIYYLFEHLPVPIAGDADG
jgi:uncharacterized membrane protein